MLLQALPEEHQSSNCTGYLLLVSQGDLFFSQSPTCNEVMAQLAQPLSTLKECDIEIQYLSHMGPSPVSQLQIPVLEGM